MFVLCVYCMLLYISVIVAAASRVVHVHEIGSSSTVAEGCRYNCNKPNTSCGQYSYTDSRCLLLASHVVVIAMLTAAL